MSSLQWQPSPRATNPLTVMSTELNSLSNGGSVLSTSIVENATSRDLYADFFLTVSFGTAPTFGYPVELYIVRSVDGAIFDDTTGPAPPMNGYGDCFPLRAQTGAQVISIPLVELPPQDFKILLRNSSGQAFAATSNTLKAYFYKRAVV